MSATTPRAYNDVPKYNDNLFPRFATFETNHVWVDTQESGAGNLVVAHDANVFYKDEKSLLISVNDYVGLLETDADELLTTISRTGEYIMSMRFLVNESFIGQSTIFKANVFVNDVHEPNLDLEVELADNNFFEFGEWNTFYRKMNLSASDTVNIKFHISTTSDDFEFNLDGLKLEIDDRDCNEPTMYTYPKVVI